MPTAHPQAPAFQGEAGRKAPLSQEVGATTVPVQGAPEATGQQGPGAVGGGTISQAGNGISRSGCSLGFCVCTSGLPLMSCQCHSPRWRWRKATAPFQQSWESNARKNSPQHFGLTSSQLSATQQPHVFLQRLAGETLTEEEGC